MYSLRLIPLGYSIVSAGNKRRAPYLNLLVYVKWPGNVRELKDFRIRPRHIWEKLNLDLGKRHGDAGVFMTGPEACETQAWGNE